MGILNKLFVLLCLLIIPFYNLHAEDKLARLKRGKHIGIVSMFPKKSGMFYDNRCLLVSTSKKISLFPSKEANFYIDVNSKISQSLVENLKFKYKSTYNFISLPSLDPETYLTGYRIEGWWGEETNNITVTGLQKIFQTYALDSIIAIVPVTYYLPVITQEGTGMNMSFTKNKLFFSSCYAIVVFGRTKDFFYKKLYGSIKQVYNYSNQRLSNAKLIKNYAQSDIDWYYSIIDEKFLPHITNQIVHIIENKNIREFFQKPKKPWYYYLPH